jgi:hypothetical protein
MPVAVAPSAAYEPDRTVLDCTARPTADDQLLTSPDSKPSANSGVAAGGVVTGTPSLGADVLPALSTAAIAYVCVEPASTVVSA